MKRVLFWILTAALSAAVLTGCSLQQSLAETTGGTGEENSLSSDSADAGPADLTGGWAAEDCDYTAEISEDEITVCLGSEDGDGTLYWRGTYEPPQEGGEPYIWLSVNKAVNIHNDIVCRDSVKMFMYTDDRIEMATGDESVTLIRLDE